MKITLFALNSSYIHTNPAIRYLADSLEKSDLNIEISLIERTLKDKTDTVLYDLYSSHSDIYGFSIYIWNKNAMLSYARSIKALLPNCKIIFGGPEVSYETDDFITDNIFVDYLIRGEGEMAIVNLCRSIIDNSAPECSIIDGTASESFTQSGILYDKYPAHKNSMLYYESSRGCPYRCAYCLSSLSGKIRAKTAAETINDLRHFELPDVNGNKNIKIIKFVDRTFNFDSKRACEIWNALCGEEFSLIYHFEICADLLDEKSFDVLSKVPNGKFLFEIGIQSTNSETLSSINRFSDVSKAIENTARLKQMGNIHIHADLIAGLPYEGYERFGKSFNDLFPHCDVLQLGFLKLLLGTNLRSNAEKYGFIFNYNPPYEILRNDYISYNELYRLHRIEGILERYVNSERFKHTFKYIADNLYSPFEFFESLSDYIDCDISLIGQTEAVKLLYEFISTNYIKYGLNVIKITDYIKFDYLLSENGKLPSYLSNQAYTIDTMALKRIFIEDMKKLNQSKKQKNTEIFIPALEVHIFSFDKNNIYFIDRKYSKYYVKPIDITKN